MRSTFILVFLLAQVVLPLRYYLGLGSPFDPRFAWRMFSPGHMSRCAVEFEARTGQGTRPIDPADHVHSGAIYFMHNGRPGFAERYGDVWCSSRRNPDPDLHVRISCSDPAHLDMVVCRSGWQTLDELMGAYDAEWKYRGLTAEEAFARECGGLSLDDCAARHCAIIVHDGTQDLCE